MFRRPLASLASSAPRQRFWRRAPRVLALRGLVLWALCSSLGVAAERVGCLIEPDGIAEVGSPVIGAIESLLAERGDRVRKGQVLATLKADVERASLNLARLRAQSDAEVAATKSNLEFLRQKQNRTDDLVKRKFLADQALDQARSETDVAQQRHTQALEQRRVLQREIDLAQAQIDIRTIRSPIDGVVAERYVSTGERVDQKQLFRIARVDPLRVELIVPANRFGTIELGKMTGVTPDVPGLGTLEARIVLVDKLIDAASNTFRVRASLPNPTGNIPAGARCTSSLATPTSARPNGNGKNVEPQAPKDNGVKGGDTGTRSGAQSGMPGGRSGGAAGAASGATGNKSSPREMPSGPPAVNTKPGATPTRASETEDDGKPLLRRASFELPTAALAAVRPAAEPTRRLEGGRLSLELVEPTRRTDAGRLSLELRQRPGAR